MCDNYEDEIPPIEFLDHKFTHNPCFKGWELESICEEIEDQIISLQLRCEGEPEVMPLDDFLEDGSVLGFIKEIVIPGYRRGGGY